MNDLTKLLDQLATKLGTTAQYLWSVLIKQARVDATIDLLLLILWTIALIVIYRLHRKFSKKESNAQYAQTKYDTEGELLVGPMIIGSIVFSFLFIIQVFCIGNIISGYFNPEYWALHKILDQLK